MFKNFIFGYARNGGVFHIENQHQTDKKGYKLWLVKEYKGYPFATYAAGLNIETNQFHIGFTLCDLKHDTFKKEIGRKEAIERLTCWNSEDFTRKVCRLPKSAVNSLIEFYDRCKKYYKGSNPAYDYLTLLGIAHNENCECSALNILFEGDKNAR